MSSTRNTFVRSVASKLIARNVLFISTAGVELPLRDNAHLESPQLAWNFLPPHSLGEPLAEE
ncbi:MAG: hypothetical protein PVI53_09970, partial [Desulfobacteraceae bacterium]